VCGQSWGMAVQNLLYWGSQNTFNSTGVCVVGTSKEYINFGCLGAFGNNINYVVDGSFMTATRIA